ncbi:MAG: type I DNA topoisomerase [Bacteroidales bacterium]|jgi:DNA topoisomerase-1|nr:type I DNA topoisomerase [Bacteroidales bacterium]MDX9798288.1 type I DNA topoisomerase [Bacteroidales bacterium]
MGKNLVIVESPAKAKTIEKFLGKDFVVKSSFGHIRDLSKKDISIDIENNFQPNYQIPADKQKIVLELKKDASKAEVVWLASDEDREGEAIAWHLKEALNLDEVKIKRIVFNEITKSAILNAVENPRKIDIDLVNAQQARRVLDRIVGYEISPILWRKVKPSLSAGRVQSVAVRLIVERENEIRSFTPTSSFKITAEFKVPSSTKLLSSTLNKRFDKKEDVLEFLKDCIGAIFTVNNVEKKPSKQTPAPPFTTSTLQQEASRKFGFPVSKTMLVAQQLYEAGHITYMRTDSVNLSQLALSVAKTEIENTFGKEYVKTRQYSTKSKGAQEAHEAIRPTYLQNKTIEGDASAKRLYELIWKRTIASQMADAKLEKTTINIDISSRKENFIAQGEIIIFDGFLKVYSVSKDDDDDNEELSSKLPDLKKGDKINLVQSIAKQTFTLQPPRYNEATLVKKLEDLGIGRPSTYAPTISTIQKREYIVREDRPAKQRQVDVITLQNNEIKAKKENENYGAEKSKLFPTDIGTIVNNFLVQNFEDIIDYNFTANLEKQFDEISQGKKDWQKMISSFYKPFHNEVVTALDKSERTSGERLLGQDPKTGHNVYAKIGRFGPMVQMGETSNEEKPKFASMKKDQRIEEITLEEALTLFQMPRNLGKYEEEEIIVNVGRFGPYIKFGKTNISIPKTFDAYTIEFDACVELIKNKPSKEKKVLKSFEEDSSIEVLEGIYGAYIKANGSNYKIPKTKKVEDLTLEDCKEIISKSNLKSSAKKTIKTNSKTTKKATPKTKNKAK